MKYISTFYRWVLLLPAVLPLFYIQGMMYPLLAPKTLVLRALGVVALALFTYLALTGKPFFWSRLRRRMVWIPATLLLIAYVSSLFGFDFYHSFWSTFERGDGLLTLTVCVEYFYLLLISADEKLITRFFKIVALVGTLASVYLIIQWLAVSSGADVPFIVKANGRIGGTMGNAAFLAAYLGMAFFATLAAAPEYQSWWRRMLYAGAGLQVFAILLTATRGTILALIFIGAGVLVYKTMKGSEHMKMYTRVALIFFVVCAGLFFTFRTILQQVPIESIHRLASISLADPTVSSRLFLWNAISREAFGRAFLGYGAENINVPFNTVYDPTRIIEEWFDRSHNAYLDYFVQFGIGGFLLYLALIIIIARTGWQLWKAGNKYGLFILGIISVYAIQNFFVFDTGVTLWFLLALAATAFAKQSAQGKEISFPIVRQRPFLGVVLGIVILFLIIPVSIQPLRANLLTFEFYQFQIIDVARANAAAQKELELGTYADLELGYNAYFMYTEEQIKRLSGDDLRMAYENAVMLLTRAFNHYVSDARTAVYLAQVITHTSPGVTTDKAMLTSALERAIRLSPKRTQPWYILANLSISNANEYPPKSPERIAGYAAAMDILTKYIATVPTLSAPHFVLAQLFYASGNAADAAAEAAKGKESYKTDLETASRAASYYETVLDLPNATFFLGEVVRLDPKNTAAKDDLAKIQAYEQSK